MSERKQNKPSETVENSTRRGFLKKAAYAAPTIVVMGALMKPIKSQADNFGPPPSGPIPTP